MKFRKTLLILTEIAVLGAFSGIAHADDDRQVWRDSDGEIVHNSWGACVRSRWAINEDPCAGPQPVAWQQPAPPPRTIISEEQRTVYFGFNKSNLTPEAKSRLDTLANQLTAAGDVEGARIVGYADRIGTTSYNERLSKKRADTVRAYLISEGFVKPSETETHWVGKTEPTASCSADLPHAQLVQCLQPDRKVSVELLYKSTSQQSQNQVGE